MTSALAPAFEVPTWRIAAAGALGATLAAALGYGLFGGWTLDGALAAARFTARFAFLWFILAWSAGALARLFPGGWRAVLRRRRRAIGLGFAAAHGVHLGALLIATLTFGDPTALATILGGGIVYVFVALMALTSNDAAVRILGPRRWSLLHATGGYMIALVFAYSYFGRLETKPWLAIPALSLLGVAALLRLAAFAAKRRRLTPSGNAPARI